MKTQKKLMGGLLVAALVLLTASSATALDRYKSRSGLFAGVGVGGGAGTADIDIGNETTGIDDGRVTGLHLQASVGGGASQELTIAAEGNWWLRTVDINDRSLSHQHLSLMATGRYFFFEGLHGGLGGGLAYAVFDTDRDNNREIHYREIGVAGKALAGYEFFLNGTIAAGVELSYSHHFYSNADFNTFNGGVTLRWY